MKVLVVDDEPLARRRLIRMLNKMPDVEVVGEAGDGEEALARIQECSPDVLLLDIRMPGIDGMSLALQEDLPPFIFTTAYDEYAVEAFEAAAVDYLMKPVTEERLREALNKVPQAPDRGALAKTLADLVRSNLDHVPRVTARAGKTLRVFDAREISRFRAADRYTMFKVGDQDFVLDDSLATLEKRLGSHGFIRVHRSELVNLDHIRSLQFDGAGTTVVLRDSQKVPVSRRLVAELKQRLGMNDAS